MPHGRRTGFFARMKDFFAYIPFRLREIENNARRYQLIFTTRDHREIYRTSPLMALFVFCIVDLFFPALVVFALLGGLLAGVHLRVLRLY